MHGNSVSRGLSGLETPPATGTMAILDLVGEGKEGGGGGGGGNSRCGIQNDKKY